MEIVKRTFAAIHYPINSVERARLNRSSVTSEYLPSCPYLTMPDGAYWYTKEEAEARMARHG